MGRQYELNKAHRRNSWTVGPRVGEDLFHHDWSKQGNKQGRLTDETLAAWLLGTNYEDFQH